MELSSEIKEDYPISNVFVKVSLVTIIIINVARLIHLCYLLPMAMCVWKRRECFTLSVLWLNLADVVSSGLIYCLFWKHFYGLNDVAYVPSFD